MEHIVAFIQGYLRIQLTIQKSERRTFYGVDNFSDDLLVIEHSLPRFATLVPVHALDVLFQKARFQKSVLHLTSDNVKNLDVWTTPIKTGMFHLREITFTKEVMGSDRQLWNVCWRMNVIPQQR